MAELFSDPSFFLSLATLTFLEVVLGIDNIVFVSIAAGRLPPDQQDRARKIGIWVAMGLRLAMISLIYVITKLQADLFQLPAVFGALSPDHPERAIGVSAKDLILIVGGLFLLGKGTLEIHHEMEGQHEDAADEKKNGKGVATFMSVMVQMALINIVFSLDSVLTAVGLTDNIAVMVLAIILSTLVMLVSAGPVADFINKHPTTKMLALSFILLIGVALLADGMGMHMPRGYLYFAIAFSLFVETLNITMFRRRSRAQSAPSGGH